MPSDLPVDPCPTGLYDDRKELWYCCTGIVNSHETGDDLKQMALGIRQQLRLEARVNELTELFYSVKTERDKFAAENHRLSQRLAQGDKAFEAAVGDVHRLRVKERELERTLAAARDQLRKAETERDRLAAFKKYVHDRLDAAGVPADPESPHKEHGCRIGGRLDIVLADRDRLREVAEIAEGLYRRDRYTVVGFDRRWLAIRDAVLLREESRRDLS